MLQSVFSICFLAFRCSHRELESSPIIEPQTSDVSKSEPLTVIEQPELTSPQPTAATANQAMKGILLSLF